MRIKNYNRKVLFTVALICSAGLSKGISQPKYFYGSSPIKMQYFGKLLNVMGADFFQLTDDSLSSSNFREDVFRYYDSLKNFNSLYSGTLENNFTQKYGITTFYSIYPVSNSEKGDLSNQNITTEFLGKIAFRKKMSSSRNKLCIDDQHFVVKNLIAKKIEKKLNADSSCIVQFIYPFSGRQDNSEGCVAGLNKEVIFYKKERGIIVLDYSITSDKEGNTAGLIDFSFEQASKILDLCIQKTWGIIRFK